MELSISTAPLAELDVELALVPLLADALDDRVDTLSEQLGPGVKRPAADFEGEEGESVLAYPERENVRRVALLGLGSADASTPERLRRSISAGADLARRHEVSDLVLHVPAVDLHEPDRIQALVEGFALAVYRFDRYKTVKETGSNGVERLTLSVPEGSEIDEHSARRGLILAETTATARDLVNLSPDDKTARKFGEYVRKSADRYGYEADIWDQERIEEEGMGGLLAVNRGSQEPPTFSVLEWQPREPTGERPIVLVGKGVMFDTGGLSLKSTKGSMDKMKCDMAGAAAVVGAMEAAARLDLPVHLIGLVPATDNRPGENAFVPGDVLRMHSGATVEVMNTDAEGRLILADALSYAKRYRPELVIDLATLTGAQVAALGTQAAAVCVPEGDRSRDLLAAIRAAGRRSGDRVEPLPMYDAYRELLESDVADLKNVGGRKAGAITAAKFLEHFVEYPWMHLDIAGPAFLDAATNYRPKGGTGFGVRLLFEYISHYSDS